MTRRLTKDELDEQFELFLKESVSDDSVDLENLEKPTDAKDKGQKPSQKPTVSWWEEEDDKEKPKLRFLKASKRQTDEADVDSPKPVPKPRASTSFQSDITPSHHQEAPGERAVSCSDEAPEGRTNSGPVGSGRRYLRSLPKSQTIREEDEFTDQRGTEHVPKEENLDTHGVLLTPALGSLVEADSQKEAVLMGADTLDEEQDKERFFAELEAGASSTIDYSKLNRDLDSSTFTEQLGHGKTEEVLEEADKENPKESPAGSPHYSDDFEEEGEVKEPEQKPKMFPILARVALYDSLDGTREQERQNLLTVSVDKAQSYAQSGGSDLEALRDALQIHMVQDSGELNRTFSSSPKPEHPRPPTSPPSALLLRPTSTNESDLPTAEELMKPIRPEEDEDVRGFSLQPISVLGQTQPEPQYSHGTVSTSLKGKPGAFDGLEKSLSGWTIDADPVPDPEPPLIQDQTWNIREELQRLMHENESPAPSKRTKKQQTSGASGSHFKRPTAAPVRGCPLESRTTATLRPSSGPGPSPVQSKPKTPRPSVSQARATRVTKGPEKTRVPSERGVEGSDLVTSVQSLVSVLQQQISLKVCDPTTPQLSPTRTTEERSVVEDLKALLLQKEKLIEKLKNDAEQLSSVQQQNYVLQSQLHSAQEALQKNRWTDGSDSIHKEKLQHMEKEMTEQENLIKGYQQENERLYQQMKTQQARSKANEEAMFKENQQLLSELAFAREQLNKAQKPVSTLCSMDHSQRITQLLDQIHGLQRREKKQSEDVQKLKLEKQALEVDLQLLRDRDLNRTIDQTPEHLQDQDQTTAISAIRAELRLTEQRHQLEVSELKKKLKWFAENQELLDRDAARLQAATAEILQLKEQVEKLKAEVSKRSSEQQRKTRERSADSKRTRDLERQVKELEQIVRSRNPNSLPALILAAAQDPSHPSDPAPAPGRVTALLERRVQRLEAELEAHDEQAKRSLRAMEQQFQAVRMRYEQQISELEQQLQQKHHHHQEEEEGSELVLVQSLRDELRKERDAHQENLTTLQKQLDSLQQQLKVKSQPSPSRHQRQAEAAFGLRIERLNQELSTKSRTIQDLTRTVERLQRERRSALSAPIPKTAARAMDTRRTTEINRDPVPGQDMESFPDLSVCDKTYQPTAFTDCHISEVLQENEALRQRLLQLQNESERQRDQLQTTLSRTQEQLSRLQEEHAQQLSSVQAQALREQTELRSAFALEHSESAVAQLTSQVNTQQILMQHLQEQLTEAQSWREALSVSRTREEALQKQLSRLLEDLKEARDSQSPEVKLLRSLEKKLHELESRHQLRDQELQQVIGAGFSGLDLQAELQRWKRAAQEKTRELDCFRLELDSILDIVRHLQKQGVVLAAPPIR